MALEAFLLEPEELEPIVMRLSGLANQATSQARADIEAVIHHEQALRAVLAEQKAQIEALKEKLWWAETFPPPWD